MNEKPQNIEQDNTNDESLKDLNRFRKASKYEYSPDSPDELKFLQWEEKFDAPNPPQHTTPNIITNTNINEPNQTTINSLEEEEDANKEEIVHDNNNEEFNSIPLSENAIDAGIPINLIPKEGTTAYANLNSACQTYTKEVRLEMTSNTAPYREGKINESINKRRQAHNRMCIMLFGTEYNTTSKEDIKKAANFAFMAANADEFIS